MRHQSRRCQCPRSHHDHAARKSGLRCDDSRDPSCCHLKTECGAFADERRILQLECGIETDPSGVVLACFWTDKALAELTAIHTFAGEMQLIGMQSTASQIGEHGGIASRQWGRRQQLRGRFVSQGIDGPPHAVKAFCGLVPRNHLLVGDRPGGEIAREEPFQCHPIERRGATGSDPNERGDARIAFAVIEGLTGAATLSEKISSFFRRQPSVAGNRLHVTGQRLLLPRLEEQHGASRLGQGVA